VAALLALALAGCTVGPDTGPDPEVEAADYPALSTVPPRPRLSYSIEQRRQIVDALVSDRANARYDREVARYEAGLAQAPPVGEAPAVIPEPVPPEGGVEAKPTVPPAPLPPGGGLIAELTVRQQVLTERNNGRLDSFLDILERQVDLDRRAEAAGLGVPPDPVQRDGLPGRSPPSAAAPAPTATPTPEQRAAGLDTFSSYLGGVPGVDGPPAAGSPRAMGGEPFELTFAPGSRQPPADAEATLRAAASLARSERRRLVVEGHGSSPALGLDRARSVASWLMRLGAPPDMVSLEGGGAGETVTVHVLPTDAA
jgi:outer membrane protein OmpA-like peptidoglycan-associated protein